jgi:glycosyltransferase involved in cell wall biosynthesis
MIHPIVLIPSFNTGKLLEATVREVLASTNRSVLVVIDGSTDGSDKSVLDLEGDEDRLTVMVNLLNEGKGAAVRKGLIEAERKGYTHALVMDADGQHPAFKIDLFFEHAELEPDAMILGQPVFDKDVPVERLYGRKLSVWMVRFEVMGREIGDPLYGFRVYPIMPLLKVMDKSGRSNRYDFDPEVAVRLNWMGVSSVKIDAPVRYIKGSDGGVSHFNYFRDNVRFVALHIRLVLEAPFWWIAKALR